MQVLPFPVSASLSSNLQSSASIPFFFVTCCWFVFNAFASPLKPGCLVATVILCWTARSRGFWLSSKYSSNRFSFFFFFWSAFSSSLVFLCNFPLLYLFPFTFSEVQWNPAAFSSYQGSRFAEPGLPPAWGDTAPAVSELLHVTLIPVRHATSLQRTEEIPSANLKYPLLLCRTEAVVPRGI